MNSGQLPPDLASVLGPLRRRALADSALHWALIGVGAWSLAASLVVAWSKVVPTPETTVVLAALAGAAAVGTSAAWALRRPGWSQVARTADARLHLDERLASALAFASTPGELAARLRRDAVGRARPLPANAAFPLGPHRRLAGGSACAAAVACALLLTPNPQAGALARQRANRAALAQARQAVAGARRTLAGNTSPGAALAEKALQQAMARLQRARAPLQALVDLSDLASRLQALGSSSIDDQAASDSAAGAALAGSPQAGALASALSSGDLKAATNDLRLLAANLPSLSSDEQRALANALKKAAASAGRPAEEARGASGGAGPETSGAGSLDLPDALAKAGAALALGRTGAAGRYLGSAASGVASSAAAASLQQELSAVEAAVAEAQDNVATQAQKQVSPDGGTGRLTPGLTGGDRSGDGPGGGPGQAAGGGEGAGYGSGGSGSGYGTGGPGGSGGSGTSGGSGGAPSSQVFVGGQPGEGEQVTGHRLGAGERVTTTGYRSVLPSFEKTALAGLGAQVVAPADQDLVRNYFSSLGAGQEQGPAGGAARGAGGRR